MLIENQSVKASTQTPNSNTKAEAIKEPTTPPELKPECKDKKSAFERLQAKEAKAKAEIAKAQAELAKVKKEARAVDTRYKILLGAYVLTAVKKCREKGSTNPLNDVIKPLSAYAGKLPEDLKVWLIERNADMKAETKAQQGEFMKTYHEDHEKRAEIISEFINKIEDEDIHFLLMLMRDATRINQVILKDEKEKDAPHYANCKKDIEQCIEAGNRNFTKAIECLYDKCERMEILKQEHTGPRM